MQLPLSISFQNMDASPAVEADVRTHAERLERLFDRIISCRVVVEAPHRRHQKGKLFTVSIDLKVPGREIAVTSTGSKDHAHEDVYVAVRDAFDALSRRLEDHARRGQGTVKTHQAPLHGKVARLFPYEGYGFLETGAGDEVYFHKNSVTDQSFDRLEVGSEVRLSIVDGEGEKGPQASSVTPIGKHHPTARQ